MASFPRILAWAVAGILLAPVTGSAAASPRRVGQPPETHPDVFSVRLDSGLVKVDLVANDVDPEGEALGYCGTPSPPDVAGSLPPGIGFSTGKTPNITQVHASGIAPGSYAVRYVACDTTGLAYGDVTVTVLPSVASGLVVSAPHRRGRLRVTNGHDVPLRFVWGAAHHHHRDGVAMVPAHTSLTVPVERRSVVYVALLNDGFTLGAQRHLHLPRSATPLPPGLAPGEDASDAFHTRWARREFAPFD